MVKLNSNLGFASSTDGVSQNYTEAGLYFKLSADQGCRDAQFWYRHCLSEGHGIPLALDYFKFCAA
jgi:TPR repeat protein